MSRFDYIKYDDHSTRAQEMFKDSFEKIEILVNNLLDDARAKALVLTKIEEAYMWTGKAIRDQQLTRGVQVRHVPERG